MDESGMRYKLGKGYVKIFMKIMKNYDPEDKISYDEVLKKYNINEEKIDEFMNSVEIE